MRISLICDSDVLTPGERIQATVRIELVRPLSRVRNISAKFHAAEQAKADYTETVTDGDGDTRTETRTAVDFNDIVNETFVLSGNPSPGFFKGVVDSFATVVGLGSGKTLAAGVHEFPIEFTIPPQAPASLEGKKVRIFYELSATIDRALALDPQKVRSFQVGPRPADLAGKQLVVRYPDEDGRSFWQSTFGKDANLSLALKTDVYKPGDVLEALVTATTMSPMKIRKATARIVCQESTRVSSHRDSARHAVEPKEIAGQQTIMDGFSSQFTLPVNLIGPPTSSGRNFEIEWFLEVTFDVPWAADPVIRAPIRVVDA